MGIIKVKIIMYMQFYICLHLIFCQYLIVFSILSPSICKHTGCIVFLE